MHPKDCTCIRCKIERSSFGTPDAKAARESVSDKQVRRVLDRARELDEIRQTLNRTGVTANTWQSAARRLAAENQRLRDRMTEAETIVERVRAECDRADDVGPRDECGDAWIESAIVRAAIEDAL